MGGALQYPAQQTISSQPCCSRPSPQTTSPGRIGPATFSKRTHQSHKPNELGQGARKGWHPSGNLQSYRPGSYRSLPRYHPVHLGTREDARGLPKCPDCSLVQKQRQQSRLWKLQGHLSLLSNAGKICARIILNLLITYICM